MSSRDALATQAQRLEQLQRAFVEISAATDEREVAVAALRGAWLGLGFGRAFWFACGQAGEKRINDSRGHAGGDEALKRIAAAMRSATRETDFPARFGGDEFALVMPRTQHADATTVIQRLVDALRVAGLPCSVGVGFADGTGTAEELLSAADAAAYVVKARGKNGFHLG